MLSFSCLENGAIIFNLIEIQNILYMTILREVFFSFLSALPVTKHCF